MGAKKGEFQGGKLWFERQDGILTVGLTHAAVDSLGELESVSLPEAGDEISKGDALASVEGSHGTLEVMAPAGGVVEEVNTAASKDPGMVAEDPVEEGWLIRITLEEAEDVSDSDERESAVPL